MPPRVPPKSPERLPSADTSIGILMARLGQIADRYAREVLTAHGLTPRQLRVLDLLARCESISQRELGESMRIDTSTLVHLLNPMERDGLVARTRDPVDRRRHAVSITAFGGDRLAQAGHAFERIDAHLAAALPELEREQLRGLLTTLLHAHLGQSDCNAECQTGGSSPDAGAPPRCTEE